MQCRQTLLLSFLKVLLFLRIVPNEICLRDTYGDICRIMTYNCGIRDIGSKWPRILLLNWITNYNIMKHPEANWCLLIQQPWPSRPTPATRRAICWKARSVRNNGCQSHTERTGVMVFLAGRRWCQRLAGSRAPCQTPECVLGQFRFTKPTC